MMPRMRAKLRSLFQVGESLQALDCLAVDLREQLRCHQIQLDTLYAMLTRREPLPRYATVMLIWKGDPQPPPADRASDPGFASTTILVGPGTVSGSFEHLFSPVPAGAWLVAIGAHLATVLIGNEMMDMAMPDRTPMVQLTRALLPGVRLSFTLVPTGSS